MLEELKSILNEEQMTKLEKYIQSEQDKLRTKYTQQIKELEKYKPKNKTEEEKQLEERLKELENKQKEIEKKERQYKIQDTLIENELPKELAKYINVNEDSEIETITSEL